MRLAVRILVHEKIEEVFHPTGSSDAAVGSTPIAIVGIGLRLPGGIEDLDGLWQLLAEGLDAVTEIPRDRFDPDRFCSDNEALPGRSYARAGGFIRQSPYDFDAGFFAMSPREAVQLDPQQRLLLEASFEALEAAGAPLEQLRGRQVGVFVGGFCLDNLVTRMGVLSRDAINSHTATGATMTMLANRVSHAFDLVGPSLTVDTACSSSLVAVDLACRSLWSGESELALAAGVNVMLRPEFFVSMAKGGFLARSGRCRAFAAAADGYVRSEGVGVVVLEPLASALAKGRHIHALIVGTGTNQDGRTPGISMPSERSQRDLIERVHRKAGIAPGQVVYVEAHGTGTAAGDPIEARALGAALGRERGESLKVGSIKTNLGHLEACAGVAGLIKAALVLERRAIPANLHFDRPNPAIDFAGLNLSIPTRLEPIAGAGRLYAAVNSFGYGGSNAHVVLASPPQPASRPAPAASDCGARPFPIGAADEAALARRAEQLAALCDRVEFADLGHTLGCRRASLTTRAIVWAHDSDDLRRELEALARDAAAPGRAPVASEGGPRRLLFIYTGMGAQSVGMGSGLLAREPVFRRAIEEVDRLFEPLAGWSLLAALSAPEPDARAGDAILEPARAQPLNFALQVGLTELWRAWGVEPDAILGHSVGEVAAAWAAGCISLADAVAVTHHRARLQQRLVGRGGMLAVGLASGATHELLADTRGVELAAINGPQSVTLSGETEALAELRGRLDAAQILARPLHVAVPYHSAAISELEAEFAAAISDVEARPPRLRVFSTVTGAAVDAAIHDAAYFARNARERVEFADAVEAALGEGYETFVEIGPHRVLSSTVIETARASDREVTTCASLHRGEDEQARMRRSFAHLWGSGVAVDFGRVFADGRSIPLPRYPWQRRRCWSETEAARSDLGAAPVDPMLHTREADPLPTWLTRLSPAMFPYQHDHVVAGGALFPASGYLAAALAATRLCERPQALDGVRFERSLDVADEPVLCTTVDLRAREITLWARSRVEDPWRRHASASLAVVASAPPPIDLGALRRRCPDPSDAQQLYTAMGARGLAYGPAFRSLVGLWLGEAEVLAELCLPEGVIDGGAVHPVLLDGAFQSLFALVDEHRAPRGVVVPVSAAAVRAYAPIPRRVLVHGRLRRASPAALIADVRLIDPDTGAIVLIVGGLRLLPLPASERPLLERAAFEQRWLERSGAADDADREAIALVIGADDDALGEHLRTANVERGAPLPDRLGGRVVWFAPDGDPVDTAVALVELAQALCRRREPPRLTVVTRDAHAPTTAGRPGHAALWGLARVIANEHPELRLRLVDLTSAAATEPAAFARELSAAAAEPELRLDGAVVLVPRLGPWTPTPAARELCRTDEVAVRLHHAGTGDLDALSWVRCERRPPGPSEVEVATTHSALNFKDLLKVSGMLSDAYLDATFFSHSLGMETAGRVIAVGPGVDKFAVGDEVVVPNPEGSLRSFATVAIEKMIRRPGPLTLAESPTMTNYVTAYWALAGVARLEPGERVLIHSASGGVGQAAVQVARWLGAEILATAGTEDKRAWLRADGIAAVFDSRSLGFVDGVLAATSGRGVDVVLNALAGEALYAGWSLVAPFGRFVEIGKRDIEADARLGLGAFDRNRSFAAIDIDRMMLERPGQFRRLLHEAAALLEAGALKALPCERFPARDVAAAFRHMSRGRHIGKVVIDIEGAVVEAGPDPTRPLCRRDRAYLVSGGLDGFGAEVARWLAGAGAGELWLVGRRGVATPGAADLVRELAARGAAVRVDALDIADEAALAAALAHPGRLPLAGVFHAAMVLDDCHVLDLDRDRLAPVFAAKAGGAAALDRLTRGEPLEHFVLFSSVAAVVGNPGQASYVAANAYLDALARRRRAEGLPALSIAWGALSGVGVVARSPRLADGLARTGIDTLSPAVALVALEHLLRAGATEVCVAAIDWARLARALPGADAPRLSELVRSAERGEDAGPRVTQRARLLTADEPRALLLTLLRDELAAVLELDVRELIDDRPLDSFGVDSLMAVELSRRVEQQTGTVLPTALLMRGPTLLTLADHLLGDLLGVDALDRAKIDALSEAELDAMLAAMAGTRELEELLAGTEEDRS